MKKEQHRYRRNADKWNKTGNVGRDTMAYSICMHPHVKAMASSFWLAGDAFDTAQRTACSEANAWTEDEYPDAIGSEQKHELNPVRDYRLVVAYEGVVENTFSKELYHLMHSADPWETLPFGSKTLSMRNHVWQNLVRAGAQNHRDKVDKSNYPRKAIAVIQHPELVDEIKADATCPRRFDSGTRAWFDAHEGAIESPDAQADQVVPAVEGRDESVQVEWRHQRIRRFVFGRSLQTKSVDMTGLNVWWVSDAWEREEASWWRSHGPRGEAKEETTAVPPARKRKHSAWNAFRAEDSVNTQCNAFFRLHNYESVNRFHNTC